MPERAPDESTLNFSTTHARKKRSDAVVPALALIWSFDEPTRVGEVFCVPCGGVDVPFTIGRAVDAEEAGALPLVLEQLRPGSRVVTGPLRDGRVSRRHLGVRLLADGGLLIERLGRGSLTINGHEVERAIVAPGDVIVVSGRFALLCTVRPAAWPRAEATTPAFPFGAADGDGIVGESPAIWELRRQIAALGPLRGHVLVHGPSGAGKELVVRALHAASPRATAPLVSRNAATIPESLIDAELFGNLRDYPNPGMPERAGLLGEANGGALYLDEIGELSHPLQARLLRVMDGGEYQRLGEARQRRSDVRVYGATNRAPSELKHDLLARFVHVLTVPGLDERPDDVPLLARHVLRELARDRPEVRERFFARGAEPRLAADFIAELVARPHVGHVRELVALLWRGVTASEGAVIVAPAGLVGVRPPPRQPEPHALPEELSREEIVAALAACDGVRERAWRHLRLHSRHQLKRLLKKYDIP